jgi:uncharacterized SAM-binding protein YcdF (DUF218 family)
MFKSPKERPAATLGASSVRRCLEAARLYRENGHPRIVVSGGLLRGIPEGPTVAQAMKEFLLELGVSECDLVIEGRSSTTFENSLETFGILTELGIDHIVLVTDAAHMPRAMGCFKALGIKVTPGCCHFETSNLPWARHWFVPTPSGLARTHYALHEWLGRIWYRSAGRI